MSIILITEQQTIPRTRLRHSRAVLHWLTYARHRLADTCKALTACLSAFRQVNCAESVEQLEKEGCPLPELVSSQPAVLAFKPAHLSNVTG